MGSTSRQVFSLRFRIYLEHLSVLEVVAWEKNHYERAELMIVFPSYGSVDHWFLIFLVLNFEFRGAYGRAHIKLWRVTPDKRCSTANGKLKARFYQFLRWNHSLRTIVINARLWSPSPLEHLQAGAFQPWPRLEASLVGGFVPPQWEESVLMEEFSLWCDGRLDRRECDYAPLL
jgi:hypothetical protein